MAFQWHWHDEHAKTVLVFNVKGRWTWEDAMQAIQTQGVVMASVDHTVDTLYVFDRSANTIPQGSAFVNLRTMMDIRYPNEGRTFYVGRNLLIEMFIRSVGNVYHMHTYHNRYAFVPTVEEALSAIAARDADKRSATR